ncbi:MAG: hypothetical protein ACFFEY_13535 [Candidatus Thorarchaeota archaeon]
MIYFGLDLIIFFIINLANIIISLIFISRVKRPELEHILGIFFISNGIPILIILIINIFYQRDWWFWLFPLIYLLFICYEFIFDYIKKVEFRNPINKKILIPYLILYYVSIILMWGLTWTIGTLYGVITGITYFLQLGCAIYAAKDGVG